jgi:hypothetical protein
VTPLSRELLKLHRHYRNGILPVAGGLYDQTAFYVDCMEIIDAAWDAARAETKGRG